MRTHCTCAVKIGFIALLMSCLVPLKVGVADVPSVIDINRENRGTDTILVIQVRHNSPSSNHYVNMVEVEVDGKVEKINGLEPQTQTSFTVEYALSAGVKSIRVRAYCNIHGWSQWATESGGEPEGNQGIPSFPSESIIYGISLAAIITLSIKRNTSQ